MLKFVAIKSFITKARKRLLAKPLQERYMPRSHALVAYIKNLNRIIRNDLRGPGLVSARIVREDAMSNLVHIYLQERQELEDRKIKSIPSWDQVVAPLYETNDPYEEINYEPPRSSMSTIRGDDDSVLSWDESDVELLLRPRAVCREVELQLLPLSDVEPMLRPLGLLQHSYSSLRLIAV